VFRSPAPLPFFLPSPFRQIQIRLELLENTIAEKRRGRLKECAPPVIPLFPSPSFPQRCVACQSVGMLRQKRIGRRLRDSNTLSLLSTRAPRGGAIHDRTAPRVWSAQAFSFLPFFFFPPRSSGAKRIFCSVARTVRNVGIKETPSFSASPPLFPLSVKHSCR